MRRRHELIRQVAASEGGERRLLARIQIYQGGRRAGGARRGWKIMDGPVAVLHWLVDCQHPRVSGQDRRGRRERRAARRRRGAGGLLKKERAWNECRVDGAGF